MKAVLYHGIRDLRVEEVPLPAPGPGEVLVKVGAALTCGTDFKAYRQGHKLLLRELPARFGHELAGTVAAVGKGVKAVKEGDRVVAANSAACAQGCFYCRRGQTQLCERLALHNGAYAEYDLIPAHIAKGNLHRLAPRVAFGTAALAEPFACALHAVDVMAPRAGETALVIGAGSMSLLLVYALRAAGSRVLVVGRDPAKLKLAKKAGAEAVFSALEGDAAEWARGRCEGRGPDAVYEAVGKAETWRQAVACARPGGKVCLFGGCAPGTEVPVDAHRVHYQQLSLHGVFHHTPRHFARAVELLSKGKVDPRLLVAGRIALEDLPRFYAQNADRSNQKVEVAP